MQKYIGVRFVDATPGRDGDEGTEGYNIMDEAGMAHFIPKAEFERTYLPVSMPNSLLPQDVDQLLAQVQTADGDPKTTIVRAELLTGFSIYETSACVDAANYDQEKGTDLAMAKIRSKIWFAMGFVLQWARYGLKNTPVILEQQPNQ